MQLRRLRCSAQAFAPFEPTVLDGYTLRRLKGSAAAATALILLSASQTFAATWTIEEIPLPALRIHNQPAAAHTQGLEVVAGSYYVTARREDVRPKRALLLRSSPSQPNWDVWDITPIDASGAPTALDHPGGMQSDGKRLWIPVAQSNRRGRTLIRAYLLADIRIGQPLRPETEFAVENHVGALAVSAVGSYLLGASWDTETVYVWDLEGHPLRTLSGAELNERGLGVQTGTPRLAGVAVQDWKVIEKRLFASGLHRTPTSRASRAIVFDRFLEADFMESFVVPPPHQGIQLGREGMAIADGYVHFLPEDLGASNRLFRVPVTDLLR